MKNNKRRPEMIALNLLETMMRIGEIVGDAKLVVTTPEQIEQIKNDPNWTEEK